MNGYCVLALVAALITLGVSRIARQITFHPFQTGYNAIKDLYYYQLHRGWHNCPVGALDIYCGYFGSGKTLSLVHKVVGLYNHYNDKVVWCPRRKKFVVQKISILSNVDLSVPYTKLESLAQVVKASKTTTAIDDAEDTLTVTIVAMDELSVQMNSRSFKDNFNAYFLLLLRKFNRAISEEVRGYFAIILVAIGIITANIYSLYNSFGEAVRQAAFQVGSIITTTGFSSCDFDLWPTLSKEILVVLMFIGACAGSTGGGIKVSRLLILGKTLGKELKQALHPQVVAPVRMDGKLLNHETIRTTNVFMGAYFFIFVVSFLLISLDGFDMVTNFTAIAATLNNIGPGLAQVGPMMNFGSFTNPAKLVMIFDMLAGRLEIFPMLVLFLPDTWRRF